MRIAIISFALMIALSCSTINRFNDTTFMLINENSFQFMVMAGVSHSGISPEDEEKRIRWLEEYLSENKICSGEYRITERKVISVFKPVAGKSYNIRYSGQCIL